MIKKEAVYLQPQKGGGSPNPEAEFVDAMAPRDREIPVY